MIELYKINDDVSIIQMEHESGTPGCQEYFIIWVQETGEKNEGIC